MTLERRPAKRDKNVTGRSLLYEGNRKVRFATVPLAP
jgi:hypothetical protein